MLLVFAMLPFALKLIWFLIKIMPLPSACHHLLNPTLYAWLSHHGWLQIDKKTKLPKVWIYRDKTSGLPKGEATITYDDPEAAKSAISWFNSKYLFIIHCGCTRVLTELVHQYTLHNRRLYGPICHGQALYFTLIIFEFQQLRQSSMHGLALFRVDGGSALCLKAFQV